MFILGLMDLNNARIFSYLSDKDRKELYFFSQIYHLGENDKLLSVDDEFKGVYLLLKGQVLVSDKEGTGIGFINENSIIGSSVVFDYSKKIKKSNYNMKAFKDCCFLIIPNDTIKNLTDRNRNIFGEVITQIRKEKKIYS